jgi:hypothetical protein
MTDDILIMSKVMYDRWTSIGKQDQTNQNDSSLAQLA